MARRQPKPLPGYDGGKVNIGTRQVESPYDGKGEVVPFNLRESNARTLRLGPAQTMAYDHMWALWYAAGHARQMGLDPSREPVDGGGHTDPLPLRAFQAAQELRDIGQAISRDRFNLIQMTCLDGMGYSEVAHYIYGRDLKRTQIEAASVLVKNAYNAATVHLGFAGTTSTFSRLQSYSDGERATDRPELREVE